MLKVLVIASLRQFGEDELRNYELPIEGKEKLLVFHLNIHILIDDNYFYLRSAQNFYVSLCKKFLLKKPLYLSQLKTTYEYHKI